MINAINKPKFVSVWQSLERDKKKALRLEFGFKANLSNPTTYRRISKADFNEIEMEWWASKLEMNKEELFLNQ